MDFQINLAVIQNACQPVFNRRVTQSFPQSHTKFFLAKRISRQTKIFVYTVSTLVFYGTKIACRQKHVFSACPEGFSGQKG